MIIRRNAGNIALKGTYFSSWAALSKETAVEYDELAKQCVFSDLSLGGWRGHWTGREIYKQLNCDFPEQLQPKIGALQEHADESRHKVAELIDNEGKGDFNSAFSYSLALQILENIHRLRIKWIIVMAPGSKMSWGHENIQLINFLAQGCKDVECNLLLVFSDESAISSGYEKWDIQWLTSQPPNKSKPESGLLYSIPGIIPARFREKAAMPSEALVLRDNSVLISPLQRGSTEKPLRDALAFFLNEPPSPQYEWLSACIYADENRDDSEVFFLLESAALRSAEGGFEIVLRLLDQVRKKTSDVFLQACIAVQRQNILLRLRNYEAAAAGPLPHEELHDSFKASLFQSKAWGLVMSNKPIEAEPFFEKARALMSSQPDSKAYLYLLNISALNKLRIGAFEEALDYEKIIEEKLKEDPQTDWHATYINSINQARLYKKSNDLVTSEVYYQKAFSITDNLRSESDLLYTNLCLAQLEERKGRHRSSFLHWFRAVIHWLSNPVPEALSPRVVQAITQTNPSSDRFIDDVSFHLSENLKKSVIKSGLKIEMSGPSPGGTAAPCPSFARVDSVPQADIGFALGDDGWSVFVGREPLPMKYNGNEYCGLSRYALELIKHMSGMDSLSQNSAVLTDPQFGCELPVTLDELMGAAIRNRVRNIRFGNRKIELNEHETERLQTHSQVRLARGVNCSVPNKDDLVVHYKRYFKPLGISSFESDIIKQLAEDSTVDSIAAHLAPAHSYNEVHTALVEMEKKHLLRVEPRFSN